MLATVAVSPSRLPLAAVGETPPSGCPLIGTFAAPHHSSPGHHPSPIAINRRPRIHQPLGADGKEKGRPAWGGGRGGDRSGWRKKQGEWIKVRKN